MYTGHPVKDFFFLIVHGMHAFTKAIRIYIIFRIVREQEGVRERVGGGDRKRDKQKLYLQKYINIKTFQ